VHQSVERGFEIIEDVGICRLKDPDFRVFLRGWM
jgi:tRNA nucleotidyltransferase (CCA-adding enzyme)